MRMYTRQCRGRQGRQSGRRLARRILCSHCAPHSCLAAPSTSMPPLTHPAPALPTLLPSTVHRHLPHMRCPRPIIAPPQSASMRRGGQPAACICRWPDPPVTPTQLPCQIDLYLRAGALAPRRCGSRPPRRVAAAPEIAPHDSGGSSTNARAPFKSISTREVTTLRPWGTPTPGATPPRTTRAPLTAQHAWPWRTHKRAGKVSHRIVARSSPHTSLTVRPRRRPGPSDDPGASGEPLNRGGRWVYAREVSHRQDRGL